jgi:hypothetical protein
MSHDDGVPAHAELAGDVGHGLPVLAPAPELLTWRVRSWGVGLAFDAVADGQVGVGVAGSGLGELLAEGV